MKRTLAFCTMIGALTLGCTAVWAINPCTTGCDAWDCSPGAVDNPGTLSKTTETICVGGSVTTPSVSGTTYTDASKSRTCTNADCTTYEDPGSYSYTTVVRWVPDEPGQHVFNSCGTVPFTAWVKGVSNDSDCPGETPEVIVGTFTVTVVGAEVKSVEFTTDHGILKDNNTDWTDTGTTYVAPEWVKSPARNNPITQTKNTSITMNVTISVCPAGLTYDLKGDGGDASVTFTKNGVTSTGGDQTFTITANSALPNQVASLTKTIAWTVKANGVTCGAGSSGAHKIYVTYGTPAGSVVTEKRMDWTATTCSGETTEHGCVAKIHDAVGSFDLERPTPPSPIWAIAGGAGAQCQELSEFYATATHLIGILGGSVVYVYPRSGKTVVETGSSGNNEVRAIGNPSTGHAGSTTHDDVSGFEGRGSKMVMEVTITSRLALSLRPQARLNTTQVGPAFI